MLEQLFRDVQPSQDYLELTSFAWRRIYTINIDDALEAAIRRQCVQNLRVHISRDPVADQDSFYERLDLVKLNGSIDRPQDGIIFSASEYAKASARPLPWYEQCASDFVRSQILFIGTKLSEPLLKFHIERYKNVVGKSPGRSYVITPSATPMQKQALLDYNIEHISGTLEDFVKWLKSSFPTPLKPLNLAMESLPQLRELLKSPDAQKYASLFDHVTPVKKTNLIVGRRTDGSSIIRNFYKGYRPTWADIVDEIPARLDVFTSSRQQILSGFLKNSIVPLVGPAGSGKTTLLMQLCFDFASERDWEVYFIEQPIDYLSDTLEAIERTSTAHRILIGIDNIDFLSDQLKSIFISHRLQRTMILGAERENIWK
ncbi:MAG: SIR2 family protein, partial [Burkholderiales bacterium]